MYILMDSFHTGIGKRVYISEVKSSVHNTLQTIWTAFQEGFLGILHQEMHIFHHLESGLTHTHANENTRQPGGFVERTSIP